MEFGTQSTHCNFFVIRKKRFCRMTVKPGKQYCGEHEPHVDISEINNENTHSKIRIPCPLDNKHTCFANKLQTHLKVCNARQDNLPSYIVPGLNLQDSFDVTHQVNNEFAKKTSDRQLASFSREELLDVINIINVIYINHVEGKVKENYLEHEVLSEELNRTDYGPRTLKHLKQASSLISYFKYFSLPEKTCLVEFGAGKGQLSYWATKAVHAVPGSSVLLVDRASHRHKKENKFKVEETKYDIQRVRADIADLDLKQVEAVKTVSHVVGLSKHLCGVATDLALLCLKNMDNGSSLWAVIMAFCCHHRCLWGTYTGRTFLEKFNVNGRMFDMMCGIVSWATCGTGLSHERRKKLADDNKLEEYCSTPNNDSMTSLSFSLEEKAEIGRRCKHIIDYGRLKFLEDLGFHCQLYYYVDPIISPENVCLVAHKDHNSYKMNMF